MIDIALIGIFTIFFMYWYSTRNFDYWKKRNVPYVKPVPFFGSFEIFRKPFHKIECERYMKYGKLYGYFQGGNPILSVADPKLIRDILVKEFPTFQNRSFKRTGDIIEDNFVFNLFGDDWKRVRSSITPTFTSGKIKSMISSLKDCSKTLVQNFAKEVEKGKPIELKKFFSAFTMDVMTSSAFSIKLDSHNDPNNKFVVLAEGTFSTDFSFRLMIPYIFPKIAKLFKMSILPHKVSTFFKDLTLQVIEERRRTGQKRNDFLQLMIDSAAENVDKEESVHDSTTSNYGEDGATIFKNISGKKLSTDEIVAQCIMFFLAGNSSTGTTLSFVAYFIALNPDVQEKVFQEMKKELKETNGEVTYDVLQKLKYLDNVISESLRIYPPSSTYRRRADKGIILEGTGIQVRKGMVVSIPAIALHMDPEYFPNPEKFDPDRFNPNESQKRPGCTYLPFGLGPRNCVGMRFALVAIKCCLVYVLSNFKIRRCAETKVPLEFASGLGLLISKNVTVEFITREDKLLLE